MMKDGKKALRKDMDEEERRSNRQRQVGVDITVTQSENTKCFH